MEMPIVKMNIRLAQRLDTALAMLPEGGALVPWGGHSRRQKSSDATDGGDSDVRTPEN